MTRRRRRRRRRQGDLLLPSSTVGHYYCYYLIALVVVAIMKSHPHLACCAWRFSLSSSSGRGKRWFFPQRPRPEPAPPFKQLPVFDAPRVQQLPHPPRYCSFPMETSIAVVHDHFMQLALEQAQQAARQGEVPIGALVVRNVTNTNNATPSSTLPQQPQQQQYEILAAQHNRVEDWHDASAHAELLALRQAGQVLENWRLHGNTTLYSTLEPCPMCLSSLLAFRVPHLVYGAPDHRLGAIETYVPLLQVLPPHPYHQLSSVTGGVRADQCGTLLREFFQQRRRQQQQQRRQHQPQNEQSEQQWQQQQQQQQENTTKSLDDRSWWRAIISRWT